MSGRTPTPWNISPARTVDDTAMIVGGESFEFGLIADVTEDDDAAFIVTACNSHAELVKALEAAVGHIEHMAAFITKANSGYHCGVYSFESLGEDMPGIRAALAKRNKAHAMTPREQYLQEAAEWAGPPTETGSS